MKRDAHAQALTLRVLQEVYAKLAKGLETGTWGEKMQLMVVICVDQQHLCGAIVISTMVLEDARAKNRMTFDILEKTTPDSKAAYIMMMGVGERYRRHGIGSELIFEGLRKLIDGDSNIECVSRIRHLNAAMLRCRVHAAESR